MKHTLTELKALAKAAKGASHTSLATMDFTAAARADMPALIAIAEREKEIRRIVNDCEGEELAESLRFVLDMPPSGDEWLPDPPDDGGKGD